MVEQLRFYLRHASNDLRVNGRRTFFALLCIAAGVAAVVALQTVGVMIGDTLSTNLQAANRSDIRLSLNSGFDGEASPELEAGVEAGLLSAQTQTFLVQSNTTYSVTEAGVEQLQQWLDENYPGQARITYPVSIAGLFELFVGQGSGTTANALEPGTSASPLLPRLIDPAVYPFYVEVRTTDGAPLNAVLQAPTDIVLEEKVGRALGVSVGDTVRLAGSTADFTVRGFVPSSAEASDPQTGFLTALGGFYYLRQDAAALFENATPTIDTLYIALNDATLVDEVEARLNAAFPYFTSTTTTTLAEQNQRLVDVINQLVTIMGLVSLLIGSIGIVNTMQVIVQRRTVEIAVLKTLGLQGSQITVLFLVEALIMGVVGSLIGIVLGWGTTFILRSAAESIVNQPLVFRIALEPALNGFIVGVVVTTIFGFLPTLSAAQVRPGIVLRPNETIIPRAGRLQTLAALVAMLLALTVVAAGILGSFNTALVVILVTFIIAGVLYILLNWTISLIGRLLPSFGLIDLKLSLRQMLATRQRNAVTLLALVAGVFSLSLLTLYAQSITNVLNVALTTSGNVLITATGDDQLSAITAALDALEGDPAYQVNRAYQGQFVQAQRGDQIISRDEVLAALMAESRRASEIATSFGAPEDQVNPERLAEEQLENLGQVSAYTANDLPDDTAATGRLLTADDDATPVLVARGDALAEAGLQVGDVVTYDFDGETITFEIVGQATESLFGGGGFGGGNLYTLYDSLPANLEPDSRQVLATVPEEQVPTLRREVAMLPGTFVLELGALATLIEGLLGTFNAFPTLVATLGLIVGGVVIANSVALSMLERRRQIAVMKSVGLQRERVLAMLLLENGILGLIGGLVGVGIGLLILTLTFSAGGGGTLTAVPYGTGFVLMLICIGVALAAALTSVWSASGEKPLNVLRYE